MRNILMSKDITHSYFIIIKKGRQCKAGRERLTPYQSEDLSPTIPTHGRKEEKGKNSRRQKGSEKLGRQKGIGSTLEMRQCHTIEYRITNIVSERY